MVTVGDASVRSRRRWALPHPWLKFVRKPPKACVRVGLSRRALVQSKHLLVARTSASEIFPSQINQQICEAQVLRAQLPGAVAHGVADDPRTLEVVIAGLMHMSVNPPCSPSS